MNAGNVALVLLLAVIVQSWSYTPAKYERPKTYCALALPPHQVASTPRLEAVYCYTIEDGDCLTTLGWIVVSEPVECE